MNERRRSYAERPDEERKQRLLDERAADVEGRNASLEATISALENLPVLTVRVARGSGTPPVGHLSASQSQKQAVSGGRERIAGGAPAVPQSLSQSRISWSRT